MAQQGAPKKKSEYGLQLEEKQKIRNEYGLRERQFRGYFDKGQKPDGIFSLLESRLDSVVYASGMTSTRRMARQIVSHGHVLVNGRKMTIASHQVKIGDTISIKDPSRQKGMFSDYEARIKKYETPRWLLLDKKKMEVQKKAAPEIKEQIQPFNFQTVVEFYSR
ncbi:MAG: 30S ribosomal protein S4 [Candidatus Spechtbacteria bacterium]|nr:30S ribosomal protein S4 [Candidatus Spechtbacteria bacterium]